MKSKVGPQAFDQHFKSVYGERWTRLKESLLQLDCKVARKNLFYFNGERPSPRDIGVGEVLTTPPHSYKINDKFDIHDSDWPLLPYYRMDPASIFAALALDVQKGDHVLDMCAAPGGKTLVLLEALAAAVDGKASYDLSGRLQANELSAKRRFRMMSVFKRHLPKEVRALVKITGVDGSKIGLKNKDYFDRILLDAPCSGERGVLHKQSDLEAWKPKRTKSFAIRQYALLASAFMAVKVGGRVVYSTCSISPEENDGVVAKLIKRKGDQVDIVPYSSKINEMETTDYGQLFLPDRNGWGPIYFSVIEKKA